MKILIVKTSSLGDIIQAFPLLQYLRYYSRAQIDWVVEKPFAELVQAHPDIGRVFLIQTKKWRREWMKKQTWQEIRQLVEQLRANTYDMVFDLQGNVKSGLITACISSPVKIGFGKRTVPEWPNLIFTNKRYNPPPKQNIREDYLFLAQSTFGNFSWPHEGVQLKIRGDEQTKVDLILSHPHLREGLKIMVCPGSNWTNKQLTLNSLKAFLQSIHKHLSGRFLLIWGSPSEKQMAEELGTIFPLHSLVIDKLALPTLQNLMSHLDVVIAMDSLPLHLAGTTETPTYSIFGASSAQKYKPLGARHQAFQGSCPYGKVFEKRCSLLRSCDTGNCIRTIQGEELFPHFSQWWQSLLKIDENI